MKDYSLTPKQEKAFASLESALKKCKKAGIYLWSDYGRLSGVNGKIVSGVCPDEAYDDPLDDFMVTISIVYDILMNADDPLFVDFK